MTTITREHGTKCHTCTTADDFAKACQDVLDNGYAKINGVTVDAFTAGMVVSVWKQLNATNKAAITSAWPKLYAKDPRLPVAKVIDLFWKAAK
jgi:uncharacterized membrane protein